MEQFKGDSSLKVWWNFVKLKPSGPGFCWLGDFSWFSSIFLGFVGLLRLFHPIFLSFISGIYQENHPFCLDFTILWSTEILKYDLMILWISLVSVMSSFSFLILLIWIFSLWLLVCLAMGFSTWFSLRTNSVSLILYIVLFLFYWFQSCVWLFPAIYSSWMCLLLFVLDLSGALFSC